LDIDNKKHISAVRALEAIGYSYSNGEWLPPATAASPPFLFTDAALRAALTELQVIVDLIDSYGWGQRWSLGKDPTVPGGKG
jgi:hypothetical protein